MSKDTYYSRNKEKCLQKRHEYVAKNRDKLRKTDKNYYHSHKEQQKLKHKIWFQKTYVSKIKVKTVNELLSRIEQIPKDTRIDGVINPTGKQWVKWFLENYLKEITHGK